MTTPETQTAARQAAAAANAFWSLLNVEIRRVSIALPAAVCRHGAMRVRADISRLLEWRAAVLHVLLPLYALDASGTALPELPPLNTDAADGSSALGYLRPNWPLVMEMTSISAVCASQPFAHREPTTKALLRLCCSLSSLWGGGLDCALGAYRWPLEPPDSPARRSPSDCRFPALAKWGQRRDGTQPAVPGPPSAAGGYASSAYAAGDDLRVLSLRFLHAQALIRFHRVSVQVGGAAEPSPPEVLWRVRLRLGVCVL